MCINITKTYIARAEKVFLRPSAPEPWSDIVKYAVASNTFRGFYRINKALPGASNVFRCYFNDRKSELLADLARVKTTKDLDDIANGASAIIRKKLSNIRPNMLKSFNKLRKPIDLYLEHLVAMADELKSHRKRLVPLLFVPLDSQILGAGGVFLEDELKQFGLSRKSTYGDVKSESVYQGLQEILLLKAREISK